MRQAGEIALLEHRNPSNVAISTITIAARWYLSVSCPLQVIVSSRNLDEAPEQGEA